MPFGKDAIYAVSEAIDYAGVGIIAFGALGGVLLFIKDYFDREVQNGTAYANLRTFLGRALLLGLEFLVAGDIIRTVAITPTLDNVIGLAIIVLVRTILSISIDVEIDGRWPWQAAAQDRARQAALATSSRLTQADD